MTQNTETPVVEQNNDTKPADNENVVNQTADSGNDTPNNVPYARFNQQVKQTNSLQNQIDELKAEKESQLIKDTNDLTEAKTKLSEYQSKIKEYEKRLKGVDDQIAKERETLLDHLSDDDKRLYSSLSNEQLRDHLDKQNVSKVANTDKSQSVRGSSFPDDKNPFEMSTEDRKKNWSEYLRKFTNK